MLYNRRPCDKIVIGLNGKATRCITMGDVYSLLDTGVELQRRSVCQAGPEGAHLQCRFYISGYCLNSDLFFKQFGLAYIF